MKLELLHYADKIKTLDSSGNIGILTLWSSTDVVLQRIAQSSLKQLPPEVCAISNFYGDGINQLLVNLLWNPQVTTLYILGADKTGSLGELRAFFDEGVEQIKLNGMDQNRIRGTNRLINAALVGPELFQDSPPALIDLTAAKLDDSIAKLADRLHSSEPLPQTRERIQVELVETPVEIFPSIRQAHQVVADGLLDAWAEVLFVIRRYGMPVELAKGERQEIQNLKVVITDPKWESSAAYNKFNLDMQGLVDYATEMLQPHLQPDTTYSYGNRLGEYFGYDMIGKVVSRLEADREDRKCYLSLWDPRFDMEDERGHPCWVGGFFRVYEEKLTLSTTFRTHRAYTAWIENAHGLMQFQYMIADRLNLGVGPLTMFSHSISIDPNQMAQADSVIGTRKWKLRDDGRGEVVFSIDDGKAVVEHRSGGLVLKRYEGANIEALSHKLAQDLVISDLNHALYVGRQLGKIQMALKHGIPYEES